MKSARIEIIDNFVSTNPGIVKKLLLIIAINPKAIILFLYPGIEVDKIYKLAVNSNKLGSLLESNLYWNNDITIIHVNNI